MEKEIQSSNGLHNFSLTEFRQAQTSMISTSDNSYNRSREMYAPMREYTLEEVERIISRGTLAEQQALSRAYFNKDGYYKQIVLYYATLLKYSGILIPNPTAGKSLSTSHIQKRYFQALDYVERMNLSSFFVDCSQKALVNGCYYGVVSKVDKNVFSVIDLPIAYCATRFKDLKGNDIIEFNVGYFNTINNKQERLQALGTYPEFIAKAYRKWTKGKLASPWVIVPADLGICFPMIGSAPFFLSVIPATIQYDNAIETEQERDKEEIRKIIIQKIPHLSDGRLLFEPEEAVEMHSGAVGMIRSNKNTSILTTYADVDAIVSRTSAENTTNTLEKMKNNIYSQAGISGEIFASSGGNTLETSIKFDTAIMMYLANKYARFITNVINDNFANTNINFKYTILPITYFNEAKYIDSGYKLATAGYSLLVPALAQGFTQRDLVNIKDLENEVLGLTSKLIAPATSFTGGGAATDTEGGRPQLEVEERSDKTLENQASIEKSNTQGGSE